MDNIDYNEIFGIEKAQAAATEAEDAPTAQEAQETATDTAPAEEAQEGAQEAKEATKEATKPAQTAEENARQAAGRRIREREFAAGREAARAEFSAVLARLGLTDPGTGEPVDTADKLEAYEKSLSEKRIANGKATAEDIRRIAREELAGQPEQQPAQTQQPAQAAPTEADFAAELEEIKRLDPEMKDLATILQSEAGPKFRQYVEKGLNFVDAYTLAARSRIAQRQAGQAQEAARVKAAGKDHLSATQSRGSEADIPVPADELEIFRAMMPGTPDVEFRKYWNKNRRK